MCLFGAVVALLGFVLMVLELPMHRVQSSLEEVLVGLTRVSGLSPSRIVIPLLCAGCESSQTRIVRRCQCESELNGLEKGRMTN